MNAIVVKRQYAVGTFFRGPGSTPGGLTFSLSPDRQPRLCELMTFSDRTDQMREKMLPKLSPCLPLLLRKQRLPLH
jgi:hypothetical protein